MKKKEKEVMSTALGIPSTKRTRRCLTSEIGRKPVFSTSYVRRRNTRKNTRYKPNVDGNLSTAIMLGLCEGSH